MTACRGSGTVLPRLLAVLALLILIATPAVSPRAAAGEPGSVPFLQVRIDRVTPEVMTTTSDPVVTVSGTVLNVGDRPVRDVMVRLEHAAAVTSSEDLLPAVKAAALIALLKCSRSRSESSKLMERGMRAST